MHAANAILRSSPHLIEHIKRSERLMLTAYFDPAGVPTAGWGHIKGITGDMVRSSTTFSVAQCERWLAQDLQIAEAAVKAQVQVELSQNQFDALVDFVFNLGGGNFRKSTLLKLLNKGDYAGAAAQFIRWNKARVGGKLTALKGLTTRREWEAKLFRTPYNDTPVPADYPMGQGHQPTVTPARPRFDLITAILEFLSRLFGGRDA